MINVLHFNSTRTMLDFLTSQAALHRSRLTGSVPGTAFDEGLKPLLADQLIRGRLNQYSNGKLAEHRLAVQQLVSMESNGGIYGRCGDALVVIFKDLK